MSERAKVRQQIDDWFAANSEDMIKDLAELIKINSVRGEAKDGAPYGVESRAVLALAEKMMVDRGFEVGVFENIVMAATYGPSPALMGILAHLDIVDVGDGWSSDPFELTLRDGNLYGRGVIDNKGPSIAAMYALYCVRDICPQLKHGVQIILGSGEETGFDDITQYLKKNTPPPNVFSPDAEYPVVNIEKGRFVPVFGAKWEKDTTLPRVISVVGGKTANIVPDLAEAVVEGFSEDDVMSFCRDYSLKTNAKISATADGDTFKITVEGKAAHASMPERGNNAQTALIEMLAAMPFAKATSYDYLCKLHELFPHGDYRGAALGIDMEDEKTGKITVNFGVLDFSENGFSGNFDSRTPGCADDVDLFGMTRSALESKNVEIASHEITGCHHTPEESPFVQKLLSLYEEYTGQPGKCLAIGGGTYVHDIEGGVVFGCSMPGEDNNVHGIDEYISLEQLILSAKMFTQAIVDMCNNE